MRVEKIKITVCFIFLFCILSYQTYSQNKAGVRYIENKNQWNPKIAALVQLPHTHFYCLKNGDFLLDIFQFSKNKTQKEPLDTFVEKKSGQRILFQWLNSTNQTLQAEKKGKASFYYNYFIGQDTNFKSTHVGLYDELMQKNVYSGIDIKYYIYKGFPRYDLIIKPYKEINQIELKVLGGDSILINSIGEAVIKNRFQDVLLNDLYVYEKETNKKINAKWVKSTDSTLRFEIGNYDHSKTLIIDPLIYSTYLGGSTEELIKDIKVNQNGEAYVTGSTRSIDFDITPGVYQTNFGGFWDVFISKLNSSGSSLLYSTFIGGSSFDHPHGLDIDNADNAYITGFTQSTDWYVSPGAFQSTITNTFTPDAFVLKLNNNGTNVFFSTYLGGSETEFGNCIAVSKNNEPIVSGYTNSLDFDLTSGVIQTNPTGGDVFVTKLNSTGTTLLFSTYIGGTTGTEEGDGLALDSLDNIYLTGYTTSSDFPVTAGAYQTNFGGVSNASIGDAFALKLNPTGSNLYYSTFIGGTGDDAGKAIVTDKYNNSYVTGRTYSTDFPISLSAYQNFQADNGNNCDAFLIKLNSSGGQAFFATYLGGIGTDFVNDITIDTSFNVYLTGTTGASNFPISPGSINSSVAYSDVFLVKFDTSASQLIYSSVIGGADYDEAYGIELDLFQDVYLAGRSLSLNFPVTPGAYQTTNTSSVSSGFVLKMGVCHGISFSINTKSITCFGDNNGEANISGLSGALSYSVAWSSSPVNSFSITSLSAGNYTVTVSDPLSLCATTKTFSIIEPSKMNIIVSGKDSICSGQINLLNVQGATTYTWNSSIYGSSISVQPLSDITYTVIGSSNSCQDTAFFLVTVLPTPTAVISGTQDICFGQSITLTGSGVGNLNWSNGFSTPSIVISPTITSVYALTISNSFCFDTDSFIVNVHSLPQLIIIGPDSSCVAQSVFFSVAGANTYTWSNGSFGNSISIVPGSTSTYSVAGENTFGCRDTVYHTLKVIPYPLVSIIGNSVTCMGNPMTFSLTGTGKLYWDTGITSNPLIINPKADTLLFAEASNYCGIANDSILIHINPLPIINISHDTTILVGGAATLSVSGANDYLWSPSDALNCTTCNQVISSTSVTTTYQVKCIDQSGCFVFASVTVFVDNDLIYFIPDIFSPNGDGNNDILYFRGKGVKEFTLTIYDRWGEKIFETSDLTKGWDGYFKGETLNANVFVYYLSVTGYNGKTYKSKGDITLIK